MRWMIEEAYQINTVYNILGKIQDPICQKWYKFITLLRSKFSPIEGEEISKLDLHDNNFGIDKQGNIKLLDF